MSLDLKTEADCRIIYADILNGYSTLGSGDIFLRHNTERRNCLIEIKRRRYLADAEKRGLLSEKDKLALLAEHGHWSNKEEEDYQQKISDLDGMRFSLKKLIIPQQQEHLEGEIKKKEKEFQSFFVERIKLLGITKEHFANKKVQEEYVLASFFKDSSLKTPLFSEEQSDELEAKEVSGYVQLYKDTHAVYYEKNFRRIAVCPFALNPFIVTKGDVCNFFGKPTIELTIYQLALVGKMSYYKNLLEDPEIIAPLEEMYENLDEVIKHFDRQYSIALGRRSRNQLLDKG
jgi:hypothetical protein